MDSEKVLHALLSLSEVSLRNKNLERRSSTEQFHPTASLNMPFTDIDYDDISDGEHSPMTTTLTTVFQRVTTFVSDLSRAWSMNKVPVDMGLLNSLVTDIATSKPTSAIYWLFLRLGMSRPN
jgi:hypothetical protein